MLERRRRPFIFGPFVLWQTGCLLAVLILILILLSCSGWDLTEIMKGWGIGEGRRKEIVKLCVIFISLVASRVHR